MVPSTAVYFVSLRSSAAATARLTLSGVGKSGSPAVRVMMSRPWARRSRARAGDLAGTTVEAACAGSETDHRGELRAWRSRDPIATRRAHKVRTDDVRVGQGRPRSAEHTSELQSLM